MRANFMFLLILTLAVGCLATQKQRHAPNEQNMRYMYITVFPDESTMMITVEFKDSTSTFRDTRVTREHEPISYSVDRRKVKTIHVTVSKPGWIGQERVWNEDVPFDVFIKLSDVP